LTLYSFISELENPPPDPYSAASAWLEQNVQPNATVLVLPPYACYPLLFRVPKLIYAWQLTDPPAPQFRGLPDIFFEGRTLPEFLVLFGADGVGLAQHNPYLQGAMENKYSVVGALPIYGRDMYRPELFLRDFFPRQRDLTGSGIYILRKK
jgi:hypothetical protein